jgi:hypothetical protein
MSNFQAALFGFDAGVVVFALIMLAINWHQQRKWRELHKRILVRVEEAGAERRAERMNRG